MKKIVMIVAAVSLAVTGIGFSMNLAHRIEENSKCHQFKCTFCNGTGWQGNFKCFHCKGTGGR